MTGFAAALTCEVVKLRRTVALLLAVAAPATVFVLNILAITAGNVAIPNWVAYGFRYVVLWALFMVPMLIATQTALIAGLEHANGGWKHLFAQPVTRGVVYTAKLATVILLLFVSYVVMYAGMLLLPTVLTSLGVEMPPGPMLWQDYLLGFGKMFVASLALVAIHFVVAWRWSSFAVAIGVAIAGTFGGLFQTGSKYGKWFPWQWPLSSTNGTGDWPETAIWASLILAVTVATIGGIWLTRRDVTI